MKILRFVLIIGLLLMLAASAMAVEYIYPTVTFAFDPGTYTYTYTITVTTDDSFPLGYVQLDTLVRNAGSTLWTMLGPVAGGVDLDWSKTSFEWSDGKDAANWYVDQSKGQQEIMPQNLTQSWVGVFTLVAPNTQPGDGWGLTMDGAEPSAHSFRIEVPGPVVPEPSSLLALGSGLAGVGGMILRRRKA